ncbi:hypothetical protein HUW51_19905 [Adhaeribacter swui]|uniref:Signal transduction histidine kinase subgroup 3 dimerisation and phosphoacceptor domain-containing protein n=1 Tax=Adhaeribacter swui TaxID=2086471 RepID=A0A7G7GCJ3_9BACT|nr:histidine kinase [Adhaeribacter swui]QNF34877.1 hypothetical protein HUW51_19905 [Adhaeribacter swui]
MAAPTNIYFSCLPQTNASSVFGKSNYTPTYEPPSVKRLNLVMSEAANTSHTANGHDIVNKTTSANTFTQVLLRDQEQERQQLASELHDNLGQSLILIKNGALKLKNKPGDAADTLAELNSLVEIVTAALQKIRNLTYELHPYELSLLGLTPALQCLAEQTSTKVSWPFVAEIPNLDQLFAKDQEIFIYRILQECLAIIQKQPDVTGVWLGAQQRQTVVLFELQVQGAATFFSYLAANFLKNYDLLRLQELLELVAGTLTFRASGNRHTTFEIKIPLKQIPTSHDQTKPDNCR